MKLALEQQQRIAEICRRYNVRQLQMFGSAAFGGRKIDLAFPSALDNPYRRRAIEPQLRRLF